MINYCQKLLLSLVFIITSSYCLKAQSDSVEVVVSIPNIRPISIIDVLHLYKDYRLEQDSIWRVRSKTGAIWTEGYFVKQYQPLTNDYILVKHGIHNYYSPSNGTLMLREVYLNGKLVDTLLFD